MEFGKVFTSLMGGDKKKKVLEASKSYEERRKAMIAAANRKLTEEELAAQYGGFGTQDQLNHKKKYETMAKVSENGGYGSERGHLPLGDKLIN